MQNQKNTEFIFGTEEETNPDQINYEMNSSNKEQYLLKGDLEETEHSYFETTDDESMAIEALRQLGGMYQNVVTTTQHLSMLYCNFCGMKLKSSQLCSHTVLCRSQTFQNWKCSICGILFSTEQSFNEHICKVSRLPCKYCYTYFSNRIELEKHITDNHNTDRPYICNFCNMEFDKSSSLANHEKIHNYLPGRDSINISSKFIPPDPCNTSNWTFENVYVTGNDTNNSENYPNYNWDTSNSLIQETGELKLNEPVVEVPIKSELMPFVANIENCLDETFPVTSMPQMEITVSTDPKKPHICQDCGLSFSREKALINHQNLHTVNWSVTYECENCHQLFLEQYSLEQHKNICGVEQKYVELNEQKIEKKQKNVNIKVKARKHRCSECDKSFPTKQKMFRHLWIHRKKTYTCEICSMTFSLRKELDQHRISSHRADSPYVCNECGKSFATRQGLWEHGRNHGKISGGQFVCSICDKTFASRQGYLIHQRTHTNERPYGCRFCLKAFRDGGTLNKHERIHTGVRPYICPICSNDFNQKVILREHVRWIHAANKNENIDGSFDCSICSVNLTDREELCAHIVKHSDLLAIQNKNTGLEINRIRVDSKSVKTNRSRPGKRKLKSVKSKDLDQEFEQDQYNIECDMCGDRFKTHEDLKIHVAIHI